MTIRDKSHYLACVSADGDEIACDTLDNLVSDTPSFIKMDVEGDEPACLRGATRMLAAELVWLIETTKGVVFSMMEQWGYRAYWVDGGTPRRSAEGGRDFFFFTDRRARDLKVEFY